MTGERRASIEDGLLGSVRDGSIVSPPLGRPGTRDAVRAIPDGLRAPATVSRLLGTA